MQTQGASGTEFTSFLWRKQSKIKTVLPESLLVEYLRTHLTDTLRAGSPVLGTIYFQVWEQMLPGDDDSVKGLLLRASFKTGPG